MCPDVPCDVQWVIRQNAGKRKVHGPYNNAVCSGCGRSYSEGAVHTCSSSAQLPLRALAKVPTVGESRKLLPQHKPSASQLKKARNHASLQSFEQATARIRRALNGFLPRSLSTDPTTRIEWVRFEWVDHQQRLYARVKRVSKNGTCTKEELWKLKTALKAVGDQRIMRAISELIGLIVEVEQFRRDWNSSRYPIDGLEGHWHRLSRKIDKAIRLLTSIPPSSDATS
jgi:hypothetical protein